MGQTIIQAFLDGIHISVIIGLTFFAFAIPFVLLSFIGLKWIVSLLRTGNE